MATSEGLAGADLCAGARPQIRRRRANGWSKAKERKFLQVLADSCNVTLDADKAKVSPSCAYRRRRADAAFRASWAEALADGYAALELEMLKRALHGVERTSVSRSGEATTILHYDDRTALALLRMHRDTVEDVQGGADADEVEEARARIVERLARLRDKLRSVETKATADAIALIRWALAAR